MREQTAEHDRLKGRYALQFKRGYNEKMGGGRWKWGDRFGSFGTHDIRLRSLYPSPSDDQREERNWKGLEEGCYRFAYIRRVHDDKREQVGKHQGSD